MKTLLGLATLGLGILTCPTLLFAQGDTAAIVVLTLTGRVTSASAFDKGIVTVSVETNEADRMSSGPPSAYTPKVYIKVDDIDFFKGDCAFLLEGTKRAFRWASEVKAKGVDVDQKPIIEGGKYIVFFSKQKGQEWGLMFKDSVGTNAVLDPGKVTLLHQAIEQLSTPIRRKKLLDKIQEAQRPKPAEASKLRY